MKRMIVLCVAFLLPVSLMGQADKGFRVGVDASLDCFMASDNMAPPSFGIGVVSRLGRRDQWFNLVGGLRYIYGVRLSGFQVPIVLNANLLRGRQVSQYLGAGYEFDFLGRYLGAMLFQTGLAGRRTDFRVCYKPYQGDLGIRFTYFF